MARILPCRTTTHRPCPPTSITIRAIRARTWTTPRLQGNGRAALRSRRYALLVRLLEPHVHHHERCRTCRSHWRSSRPVKPISWSNTSRKGLKPGSSVPIVNGVKKPGDVPGYTKLNAYRVWGNILRLSDDYNFGSVTGQVTAPALLSGGKVRRRPARATTST